MRKQNLKLIDRNKKEFKVGDICKYKKVRCGNPNQLFVVIKREGELGLHRQGFYEEMCAGCWDYTGLKPEAFDDVSKNWEENGKNYDYKNKEEYLDLYCMEIIGNVKDDKDKFELDPQYYK